MISRFFRTTHWRRNSPKTLFCVGFLGLACIGAFGLTELNQQSPQIMQTDKKTNGAANLLDGQWSYMPGSRHEKNSLHVFHTNRSIVEQDGSGGQANPPINLYGTHLEEVTDLKITTAITDRRGEARLQLYGMAPIVADEFRIERASVQIGISDSLLRVLIWNGKTEQPVVSRSQQCTVGPDTKLSIEQTGKNVTVRIPGCDPIVVIDQTLFAQGTVWFGMDADDSWRLSQLSAEPLNGQSMRVADSSSLTIQTDKQGKLQHLASNRRKDITIGAAMALGPLSSDRSYAQVALGGDFGALTTENALKWQFVHPMPDVYAFGEADAMVDLAEKHHLSVHGHALVFGEANPSWIQSAQPQNTEQLMVDHIKTVVGRYKGKIASWDVVNEPIADYDDFDADAGDTLRKHLWLRRIGESYIATAFRVAHEADPQAKLFINDYGLEEDGERWDTMLALVKNLKRQGVPIHGVGFQSHVYEPTDRIYANTLRKHMQQLASIGLLARVSEIDVYASGGERQQATQYADVLGACMTEKNCISYTTWGISDRYNVYKDDGKIAYGKDFLWTEEMQPTLAVRRMQDLLGQ